jgi:DNA repair photolyase
VPDRTLLRRGAYIEADAVQATRGCPHGCSFCSIAPFFDHTFRSRPVEEVVAELGPLGRLLMFMNRELRKGYLAMRRERRVEGIPT